MSLAVMSAAWKADCRSHTSRLVLLALADHAQDDGKGCYPSITSLATKCCLSRQAVIDNLDGLAVEGHITMVKTGHRSKTYTVHPQSKVERKDELKRPKLGHPLVYAVDTSNSHESTPLTVSSAPLVYAVDSLDGFNGRTSPSHESTPLTPLVYAIDSNRKEPSVQYPSSNGELALGVNGNHSRVAKAKRPSRPKKETSADPRHAAFIKAYCAAWEKHIGEAYSFKPRDAKALKMLLQTTTMPVAELMEIVLWSWRVVDQDKYAERCVRQAAEISGFCHSFNLIRAYARNYGRDSR